jgi:hypothetical protein
MAGMVRNAKHRRLFYCEEYPQYTFSGKASQPSVLVVGVERGLDPMLMIDLLVGEVLSLVARGDEEQILCCIATIDASANGRKALITVKGL